MRDESLTGYAVYDGIFEDRSGSKYSVWYAIVKGRVWFVEYAARGFDMERVDFQVSR